MLPGQGPSRSKGEQETELPSQSLHAMCLASVEGQKTIQDRPSVISMSTNSSNGSIGLFDNSVGTGAGGGNVGNNGGVGGSVGGARGNELDHSSAAHWSHEIAELLDDVEATPYAPAGGSVFSSGLKSHHALTSLPGQLQQFAPSQNGKRAQPGMTQEDGTLVLSSSRAVKQVRDAESLVLCSLI